jgi:hypothetical protein
MAIDLTEDNDPCTGPHEWGAWKIIAHTGDWFHPYIIERRCAVCPAKEQDES